MKHLIIVCLAASGLGFLSGCTTVEDREPAVHSTTTTTEETSVHRPVSAASTTETRTIRAY